MIRQSCAHAAGLVLTLGFVLICIVGVGCDEPVQPPPVNKSEVNAELISAMNDMAMENAIISQHTLFPYHFINNSDKLNELGQRDLAVLVNHFKENPGILNVRRDGTPENLYQARVAFVAQQLRESAVYAAVELADGMPGGSGMSSENVLRALEREDEVTTGGTTVQSGTGSRY